MTDNHDIYAQVTPNPNTLKFVVNTTILESGTVDFSDASLASHSPLVDQLFAITGVDAVMLGQFFISVTKTNAAAWGDLAETVTETIKVFMKTGAAIIDATVAKELQAAQVDEETDDDAATEKIKQILNDEIRPAVAMDGGDVQFKSFKDGILTLNLQGACSACPSATFTLKMGIENRLKEDIPEIVSVVQEGMVDPF